MQARRLPARQGMVWVIAGYRLFRANMPLLSVLAFGYLMAFTVMLVLPGGIGGVLFPLLQPRLDVARHVADIEFDLELRDLHGAGEPHVVALPKF